MLALHVVSSTAPLRAQDSDEERTAAARALFEEGMQLVREGDLVAATDRLRRSLELRPSAVVAFNLSTALVELGRLVEASEHLRAIVREESAPARVREAAEARLAELLPRIGRLTVRLEGPADGVVVSVDEAPLADALIGVAQPIDPGAHVVAARRAEGEVARQEVVVDPGTSVDVALRIPPLPSVTLEPPRLEDAVERTLRASEPTTVAGVDAGAVVLWTSLGVAAAAAITTLIVVATQSGPTPIPGDFEPGVVRVGR